MHVGFYHDTTHLNEWDWEEVLNGRVPLSGTDGQMFRIVHELAKRSSIECTLVTTCAGTTPSATGASQVAVDDFVGAVRHAHSHQFEVLVFVNIHSPDVIEGLSVADRRQQACIAWCQNGPWRPMSTLYAETDAVRRVVCVTRPHADIFRDKSVFEKIEVVHNGVDAEWYRPHSSLSLDRQSICYVGAITPDKGFHHIARAWSHVRDYFPDAKLTVVGGAHLYDRSANLGPLNVASPSYEYAHLVPVLGSSRREALKDHRVDFQGLLPPRDTRNIMQACTLGIVNPNLEYGQSLETFCVAAAEFQAAGTPVVGGNRRGLRETVQHEETGILIDSTNELAPTLRYFLNRPEKARFMGERGLQWVTEMFDFPIVVKRWQQVLEATAQDKPPTPPSFSFQRAVPKTFIREGIRRLHSFGGEGRIPLLDRLLDTLRGMP